MEQVLAWEMTFIGTNHNRMSQNSKILFDMLMNTLSVTGLQQIPIWRDQYTINGDDAGRHTWINSQLVLCLAPASVIESEPVNWMIAFPMQLICLTMLNA